MGAHTFEDLSRHLGHKIECVAYGPIDSEKGDAGFGRMCSIDNIAVECDDCHEVLIDFDRVRNIEQETEEFEHEIMTFIAECDDKDMLTHIVKMTLNKIDEL